MEFSFQNSNSTASPQSDRLRKAIERNRAKQARRESKQSGMRTPPPRPSSVNASPADPQQSLLQRLRSQNDVSPKPRTVSPGETRSRLRTAKSSDDVVFVGQKDVATRKSAPPAATYTRARRKVATRKKSKATKKVQSIGYKIAWVFCFVLIARLVFSEGGVVEYYDSKGLLNERISEKDRLIDENQMLAGEIQKMKSSRVYQKKLVRDHLGFIARDEFLIIFPN